MTKPHPPSTEVVAPSLIDQRDGAGLPLVERRGAFHSRRIALTSTGSQVSLGIDVRGEVLPHEVATIVAEVFGMRRAAGDEQRRLDVLDERASEIEALAGLEAEELYAMRSAAERIGDETSVLLYSDALDLKATYAEDATVELALRGRGE